MAAKPKGSELLVLKFTTGQDLESGHSTYYGM
jgi:hypothetical protein